MRENKNVNDGFFFFDKVSYIYLWLVTATTAVLGTTLGGRCVVLAVVNVATLVVDVTEARFGVLGAQLCLLFGCQGT